VSSPSRPLPAGAWDTHAHVFGPFDRYPLAADCRYQPPLGPAELHLAALDAAGFAHGVLVHASANGFDNSAVLDAARAARSRLAVVAVVREETSDTELARMRQDGVCALRFTETGPVFGAPKPSGTLGLDALQRMAPRLRALGLHAQIWARCEHIADAASWLAGCGVPLVFDHMGQFDVSLGAGHASFRSFLSLLGDTDAWVKLIATRVTRQRWCEADDVRPFHDALLQTVPDRALWGSDWPYIALDTDLPDIGRQIDLFDRWTPDEGLRRKVYVENPARLYGRAA
jgi:predicted TIM-barrel fold metal-dependent hydrolase